MTRPKVRDSARTSLTSCSSIFGRIGVLTCAGDAAVEPAREHITPGAERSTARILGAKRVDLGPGGPSPPVRETDMGRIFETRKTTMFARWDRMAKAFTRVSREIEIAVKAGGPSPDGNPALRRALQNARSVNMPKDRIQAAIKRASGQDAKNYDEILYEGYAPHGVAVLVVTATDNPTRTVANIRTIFNKGGGNLGASGSVSFLFKHMGVFRLDPEGIDQDELELDLIDHGLEEMGEGTGEKGETVLVIRCDFNDFGRLQKAIEERGLKQLSAGSEYIPTTVTTLPEEQANEVLELIDRLEQDDDVQHVFHNLG